MKIDRNNYELYALDFLEGSLSHSTMKAYKNFLDQNPDLKEEVFSVIGFEVVPTQISLSEHDLFKKTHSDLLLTIPAEELDCIAYLEKDLDLNDSVSFLQKTDNTLASQSLLEEYSKIKLFPGEESFSVKESLKRPVHRKRKIVWLPYAVAAIILIALLLRILVQGAGNLSPIQISNFVESNIYNPTYSVKEQYRELPPGLISPVYQKGHKLSSLELGPELVIIHANSPPDPSIRLFQDDRKLANLVPVQKKLPEILFAKADLHAPTIYIKQYLTDMDLAALEAYSLDDFKVKLLYPAGPRETYTPLLYTIAKAGVDGINLLTGSKMKLESSVNKNGTMSSFAFVSPGLKLSSQLQEE